LQLFLRADHGFNMEKKIVVGLSATSPEVLKVELLKYNNIENVTAVSHVLAAGQMYGESYKRTLDEKDWTDLNYYATDEDYLKNLEVPLVAGRYFLEKDGASNKNFIVLKSKQAFLNHYKNGWYYSEFIDKDREFRVHVVMGKVLAVLEKPRPDDGGEAWNRAINGEAFELQEWKTVKKDIMLQACRAVKALGLDIGAADVLFKDDQAYVVEVNSSPTLNSSPHVTEKYAKVFEFIFRNHNGTKLKPWNFENWQKRVSFFWKDSQLNASNFGNDVNNIVNGVE